MSNKIKMDKPVVEMDGDEMTRVMWTWVKKELLEPYVDLKTEYYDLDVVNRDRTDDKVTFQAADAVKKWGVGVKCATITPNAERVKEFNLKKEWPSPNGTIRKILDGTVFRAPILVNNIKPAVRFWTRPIIVARHAFGDIYDGIGIRFDEPGVAEISYVSSTGKVKKVSYPKFSGPGILQGVYNIDKSIEGFARASFRYSIINKLDLWFATKDTISKVYDARFKEIFNGIYEREFKEEFARNGISYNYFLIDDAVARVVRSEGGFVWACKNYDGDVFSDFVSTAYVGTLALMTSELLSPEGYYLSEAAHGTVQKHYYRYVKGEKVSSNPTALIFAWTRGLKRRGEIDGNHELIEFSEKLEKAVTDTIEKEKIMTQDVARIAETKNNKVVDSEEFVHAIRASLDELLRK
ncbi:MAG: NADP-dependent isocitrate dehydrogenase [Candidatus Thermoplasmatota archaeon]|jgi:isocitrate dehydrogenase|nr:NADP-dependent isocitrate dehydrogenase [Candidatus Thermoplasmatota archaeon]